MLLAALPVSELAKVLPVPLMATAPVRISFSTLTATAKLTELLTVSVP